jgi:hypothetical protein
MVLAVIGPALVAGRILVMLFAANASVRRVGSAIVLVFPIAVAGFAWAPPTATSSVVAGDVFFQEVAKHTSTAEMSREAVVCHAWRSPVPPPAIGPSIDFVLAILRPHQNHG